MPEKSTTTRELDKAVGGGEAPVGPLGGPEPKTREELLKEQDSREEVTEEPAEAPAEKTPRAATTPKPTE